MKTMNDYAYQSAIKNAHPTLKILFGAIPLVLILLLNSLSVGVFVLTAMGAVTWITGRITIGKYLKLLMIPLTFLILGIIPILFQVSSSDDMLFGIRIGNFMLCSTRENIKNALLLLVKAMSAVSCTYFIALSTTMNDLLYAMKQMKVPKMILSLMEFIYRYIFVLFEEYSKIFVAQRARLGYKNFRTSVVSCGQLIAALFIKTYDKCGRVYHALESRGYSGEIPTLEKDYEKNAALQVSLCLIPVFIIAVYLLEKRWAYWI